ncbi:MAG: VWA domain-containing protein [Kofleriaceae bacterium]|nr:VWA domain-containing protein [Kofleriaceae bacterium]
MAGRKRTPAPSKKTPAAPPPPAKVLSPEEQAHVGRWRLVLGKSAEQLSITTGDDLRTSEAQTAIDFVFQGDDARRGAGRGDSALTVPTWIDAVSELFPRQAKEVLERELISRRGITELLEHPQLLEKVEPNVELVKTLLTHKDLLDPRARVLARKIIDQVVEQLKRQLEIRVEAAITGALRRDRHSPRKVFKNLDLKKTLRKNLHNWDDERRRLLVDQLFYFAAERNKRPWHIIVCVDQSGSMLDSAIFSAVMASIFAELPAVKTSLVLFDTNVVDLSAEVGSPVDVLLKVQLGGGTDITQALVYCAGLVAEPARSIVVLITDFFEGRDEKDLVDQVRVMSDTGVRMIGLGALGYDARPEYNKSTAGKCRKVGMDILVCTPERLAEAMAEIIGG